MSSFSLTKLMALVAIIGTTVSIFFAGINSQSTKGIAFDASQQTSLGKQITNSSSLASEVGADYSKLQNLLKSGRWREADEETTRLMFEVALQDEKSWETWTDVWISPENMAKFPCTDLRTINQLWSQNSKGSLGFSVQKRIFEEVGQDWLMFQERLGWYSRSGDVNNETLMNNPQEGRLPLITREISWSSLTQRLAECRV